MTNRSPSGEDVWASKIRFVILGAFFALGLSYVIRPLFAEITIFFSPLWFYGVFICVLTASAVILDRHGRSIAALIILYFLFIDISLSLITYVAAGYGYGISLKPAKSPEIFRKERIKFHPLLQLVPRANYSDETFAHTSFGTRVVEDTSPSDGKSRPVIALVGGSTTYDTNVEQGRTWAEHLQRRLTRYRILNFGVPGHSTVEHVILTAVYLPAHGVNCAVYYVGWNDLRNSFVPNLDPGYADYHIPTMGQAFRNAGDRSFIATFKLIKYLISLSDFYTNPRPYHRMLKTRSGFDPQLEQIYRRNINSIIALNNKHGIRTAFIGQLLNHQFLLGAESGRRWDNWMAALEDRAVPAAMDHLNSLLHDEAQRNGVPFLQPQQDWLQANDYADPGHFTAGGAAKFADRVSDFISNACGSSDGSAPR